VDLGNVGDYIRKRNYYKLVDTLGESEHIQSSTYFIAIISLLAIPSSSAPVALFPLLSCVLVAPRPLHASFLDIPWRPTIWTCRTWTTPLTSSHTHRTLAHDAHGSQGSSLEVGVISLEQLFISRSNRLHKHRSANTEHRACA
jgi:hypothetical protein